MIIQTEDRVRKEKESRFCEAVKRAGVRCGDYVLYRQQCYRVIGMYTYREEPCLYLNRVTDLKELRLVDNLNQLGKVHDLNKYKHILDE